MIRNIRHKGLRLFWKKGQTKGLNQDWVKKIDRILSVLNAAANPADMNLPGYRLHPLKGEFAGFYAVDVSGNWRIIFRFENNDATDVDLIDYH